MLVVQRGQKEEALNVPFSGKEDLDLRTKIICGSKRDSTEKVQKEGEKSMRLLVEKLSKWHKSQVFVSSWQIIKLVLLFCKLCFSFLSFVESEFKMERSSLVVFPANKHYPKYCQRRSI